ncbi:uncharacterized protein [Triticum aestivum]|uniref:uncharacterized protein isoform X1 n=1 Tax=Triticum aestivum TaxID=4565 RepID=UPI001D014A86|nr:uncharacterized protein LOC123166258 isoform X1 [Triticum aestivum]
MPSFPTAVTPPSLCRRPTRRTPSLPYFPLHLHGHAASPAEPRCGRYVPPRRPLAPHLSRSRDASERERGDRGRAVHGDWRAGLRQRCAMPGADPPRRPAGLLPRRLDLRECSSWSQQLLDVGVRFFQGNEGSRWAWLICSSCSLRYKCHTDASLP